MRLGISTKITQPYLRGAVLAPPAEEERISLTFTVTVASDTNGDLRYSSLLNADGNYYNIVFPLHFYDVNGASVGEATEEDPFIRNSQSLIDAHYDITLNFLSGKNYGNKVFIYGSLFPSVRMSLNSTYWTDDALDNLVITINNSGKIVGSGGWGGTGGGINKQVSGGGGGGGAGIHPVPSTTTSVSNGGDGTTGKPFGAPNGPSWLGAGGAGCGTSATPYGERGAHGGTTASGSETDYPDGGAGGASASNSGTIVSRNGETGGPASSPFWMDWKEGLDHENQPEVTVNNSGEIKCGGGGGGASKSASTSGGAGGDAGYVGSGGSGSGAGVAGSIAKFRHDLPASYTNPEGTPRAWTIVNNGDYGDIRTSDVVL